MAERSVTVKGIPLNVDWRPGRGVALSERARAREIPALPGIYAFVSLELTRSGRQMAIWERLSTRSRRRSSREGGAGGGTDKCGGCG
jgi:hypothetical protein